MPNATLRTIRTLRGFAILAGIAAVGRTAEIDLASPRIIISAQASAVEKLMARELCRCRTAHWPKGYPDVVWSAAISP